MADRDRALQFVIVTHALLPNGPAQRLVAALESRGHDVALCALPMLGSDRTRSERHLSGAAELTCSRDLDAPVPWSRLLRNALEVRQFLRTLKRRGWKGGPLIACDGLAFLLTYVMALGTIRLRPRVVYFVDFSPQRLERRLEGIAYTTVTRWATSLADSSATISEEARRGFSDVIGHEAVGAMKVIPNLPMEIRNDVAWNARPMRVVSLGGLRIEHGALLLPKIICQTWDLAGPDIEFHIAGKGPAYGTVVQHCKDLPNVTFHGTLESSSEIGALLGSARVGLALYDPSFPMFAYNSPLKIRDYLTAGLKVVTTWPAAREDESVIPVAYSANDISIGVVQALALAHEPQPKQHKLVTEGEKALDGLLDAIGCR